LYLASFNGTTILQYDLAAGNASAIRASQLVVANLGTSMACLQLGPDGRIYIAGRSAASLSVIQYPNLRDTACGFLPTFVNLWGRTSDIGLPNTVVRYAERSIRITGPQRICITDSVQTFTVASKGCSRASHIWRVVGNATIVAAADTTVRVRVHDSGNVMLIAEKFDNCGLLADTLRIRVLDVPQVDLGADTALCSGTTVLLDAGPGFSSYLWQDGSAGQTFPASGPGIYWVEISLDSGCTARDTVEVFPNDDSLAVNLGRDTTMCDGILLVLDAGPGALQYRWQDGSADRRLTAYRPGTYWVEVMGHCGSVFDTIVIQPEVSAVTLGRDTALCGSIDLLLDAGAGFVNYLWQDGSTGQTFDAHGPGMYWVEAVLGSGCIARDTIRITAAPNLTVGLGPDTAMCEAAVFQLDAGPGFVSYLWQDGSTGQTFKALGPGIYWVEAVLESGCIARDTIRITAAPNLRVSLGPDRVMCDSVTLQLDAGSGFASYLWQDGSSGRTFDAHTPGLYWVEIGGGSGCIARDTIAIAPGPSPIDLGRDTAICGVIDMLLNAGPGYSQYLWQDGSNEQTLNVTAPGTYRVQARVGECDVVGTITIRKTEATGLTASLAATPSIEIAPGTEIAIPLRLTSVAGASLRAGRAYTASIHFNRTILLPTGSTPQGFIQGKDRSITIN
ncbi:MAG: hypothetical protein ABI876_14865, partial [Bacteroidota bacterium]